ncbi:autotransporter-associated beta strand repeat-containing protein [bacterium]|nr:autotransporter-associated beta strand repeat-containing protein [Akkermansiaceae bacterium]MDB4373488.1 autotransporter-associated beta strand repeat-containing protein [Akkermansiaceae bacterium]MDB4577515.1 autotransporter-associated beta strand repeat-containing protein [bacterium]MDB4585372.1 autotransporter-associated beta strand repeat-containing protein [Akkermansiaceae bacterium]
MTPQYNMKPNFQISSKFLMCQAFCLIIAGNASAATFTWVGNGNNRWSTVTNWADENGVATALVSSNETDLVFADSPRDAGIVTRNPYTVRSLTFDGTIGAEGHAFTIFRSATFQRNLILESSTGTASISVDAASTGNILIAGGNVGLANEGLIPLHDPLEITHNGTGTLTFNAAFTEQAGEANGITKLGTGKVEMNRANRYTGNTVLDAGVLEVGPDGQFLIVPEANGVSNSISGQSAATLSMNGVLNFDLSGADPTVGNSWLVADGSNLMIDYDDTLAVLPDVPEKTFQVTSSLGDFSDDDEDGIWELGAGTIVWQFDEATGLLTVEEGGIIGFWTGNINNVWDPATTANWSSNEESDPLASVTFDVATATTQLATFADTYPNSGQTSVTQSMVDIALGGVETNQLVFENDTVNYLFTSPDTEGITGSTSISLEGIGEVTLLGTHATTGMLFVSTDSTLNLGDATADGSVSGTTIVNDGVLNFTTAGAITQDGEISGEGSLDKQGVGTVTVSANTSYSGGTTIDGGVLTLQGLSSSPSFTIAAGAVMEFSASVTRFNLSDTIFEGDGTILKTGLGQVGWVETVATFSLNSGSLIDVQEGQFRAGASAAADVAGGNEIWTDNLSDLNIAAGALFRAREANVRVDALTGEGMITSGYHTDYQQFTIGVDNGSEDFAGQIADTAINNLANITKVGTGTQSLSGLNTYTGNTVIEDGVITVAAGGQLTMRPYADGVNNVISGGGAGTGTLNFDGALNITLTDAVVGGTWVLIDDTALELNYGSTFSVSGARVVDEELTTYAFTSDGAAVGSGVWTLVEEGGNTWVYNEATRTLTSGKAPDPNSIAFGVENDPNVPGNLLFAWGGEAGVTYKILGSTDLSVSPTSSWADFLTDIDGVDGLNTFSIVRPEEARAFFVLTTEE